MSIQTKKSLGQHFLKSEKALREILEAGKLNENDLVLEIGPGEGVLTEKLNNLVKKVVSVEKDYRLIPILQEKFKENIKSGKLEIIEKDILEFDPESLKSPYKIIANIPYYITGQILRMFLESKNQPQSMTLLVQKEVAERILARDGKESLLSISVKIFGDPKIVAKVPRGAFNPQPDVDSAILNIENISKERFDGVNPEKFWKILHAGFAHKRKQLLPNLSSEFSKENLQKAFEKLNLNTKIRAEDVSLEIWIKLSKILE